jgi:hypothetical protein
LQEIFLLFPYTYIWLWGKAGSPHDKNKQLRHNQGKIVKDNGVEDLAST